MTPEAVSKDQIETLERINLDDFVEALGWRNRPALSAAIRLAMSSPARRFAHQMSAFDASTGRFGLVESSRRTLQHYVKQLLVFGTEHIPTGPFLALSNHPGMTDTLALFCALHREDLKIIAGQRPFLQALPNVEKHLLYVRTGDSSSSALVRDAVGHLQRGGALLTFPAARIEPDPDVHDGAVRALHSWTASAGTLARMVPDTPILPVLVRGVVWPAAARSPLTLLRRLPEDRDRLAAALQVLGQLTLRLRPVGVRVCIGNPIRISRLARSDRASIHAAVLQELQRLIELPPTGEGRPVL